MANLQWLGQMQDKQPSEKQKNMSLLADAIREGTQSYMQTKLAQEKHKLALKELSMKEGEIAQQLQMHNETLAYEKERDTAVLAQRKQESLDDLKAALARVDVNKKKELANILLDSLNMMDEQRSKEFLSRPEVQMVFESAGIPLPTGAYGVRPKDENAWGGIGRGIESIGAGLGKWLGKGKSKSNIKSITAIE